MDTLILNNYNDDQFAEAADRNSSKYISTLAIKLAEQGDLKDVFAEEASITVGGGIPIAQKIFVNGLDMLNLNVTIDGTMQNNRTFHHVTANAIDPGLLKAVRVDAGVAAADFGPNALAGSVAFQTVDALDLLNDDQNFGATTIFSYDTNSQTLSESAALYGRNGSFDYLGYFKNAKGDDYTTGGNWQIPGTAADLQSFLFKGGYSSTEGDRFEASAQVMVDDAIRPFRANFGGLSGTSDTRGYDTKRSNFSFRYVKEDATGFWDPEIALGYSENEINIPSPYGSMASSDTLNGKFGNTFHLDDQNTITSGFDFYVKTSDYEDPSPYTASEKSRNFGLFTQVRLQPVEPLKLSFGGRFDTQNFDGVTGFETDVDGFSGNASVAYEVIEGLTLKAGYANVFGGIGLEDNFIFDTSWDYSGLQASRSESVTGGFEYKNGDFSFSTELFKTEVENARSGVLNGDFATEGFNLGFGYSWLSGSAKITYSNSDISVDGAPADGFTALDFAAPLGETIAINVSHELEDWDLLIGAKKWFGNFEQEI